MKTTMNKDQEPVFGETDKFNAWSNSPQERYPISPEMTSISYLVPTEMVEEIQKTILEEGVFTTSSTEKINGLKEGVSVITFTDKDPELCNEVKHKLNSLLQLSQSDEN